MDQISMKFSQTVSTGTLFQLNIFGFYFHKEDTDPQYTNLVIEYSNFVCPHTNIKLTKSMVLLSLAVFLIIPELILVKWIIILLINEIFEFNL